MVYDGPAKVEGVEYVRAAFPVSAREGSSAARATRTCDAAAAACARAAARSGRLRRASLMTLSTLRARALTGIAAPVNGSRSKGRFAGSPNADASEPRAA